VKIEGTPVYMDVEGLPDRDFYYLIAFDQSGRLCRSPQAFGLIVFGRGQHLVGVLVQLVEVENPVLIRYGSFETVFLSE